VYTATFKTLIAQYRDTPLERPHLRAASLALWILESQGGISTLARDHRNFARLTYHPKLANLCRPAILSHPERGQTYCSFQDLPAFVSGFWQSLDLGPQTDWRDHAATDQTFLLYLAGIWGNGPDYLHKLTGALTEARILLAIAAGGVIQPNSPAGNRHHPALTLCADGKMALGTEGLNIRYSGDDRCPYGRSATRRKRDFEGIILHHTSPRHSTDWYVQYQLDGDAARGGHFGYHFYISPDGDIVQGAPLTARTNHISANPRLRSSEGGFLQNTNALGIACAEAGTPAGFTPTQAQQKQVKQLVFALCATLDLPFKGVYGHGEIQSNRHPSEGRSLAVDIRAWDEAL
jgi:hypothetical protein